MRGPIATIEKVSRRQIRLTNLPFAVDCRDRIGFDGSRLKAEGCKLSDSSARKRRTTSLRRQAIRQVSTMAVTKVANALISVDECIRGHPPEGGNEDRALNSLPRATVTALKISIPAALPGAT